MVNHIASEAVLDAAHWAVMVTLILILSEEQVVAAVARALDHARLYITDLLPFELLAAVHLLGG